MSQVAPDRVRPSVEESLRKLQTEYVDLLLIHWPVKEVPLEATLEELFRLQAEGKTRQVGVSNFPIALLEAALKHGPIFNNQVERHPYLAQTRLTQFCQAHGVLLTAYSPLARGKVSDDPTLQAIGAIYGKTAAQVALRWFLEQDGVAVIPKAAKRAHLEANFNVFDFSLNADDMARIATLDRGQRLINPGWAPAWD
jgi:2,5-diketo-D-gluconate reductase B